MLTERILLKLDPALLRAVTHQAKRWKKSRAEYIREAIANKVDVDKKWSPDK